MNLTAERQQKKPVQELDEPPTGCVSMLFASFMTNTYDVIKLQTTATLLSRYRFLVLSHRIVVLTALIEQMFIVSVTRYFHRILPPHVHTRDFR